LKYSGLSLSKLAKKYNCSRHVITDINYGIGFYHDPTLQYPLMKTNRIEREKIKQIKYALKYELDKTITEIANEYGVSTSSVNDINLGKRFNYSNENYPLRNGLAANSLDINIINSIINDLQYSNLSQTDIASKYNVSTTCVSEINTGSRFFNSNLSYPIRDNSAKRQVKLKKILTFKEVSEIEYLLLNTKLSMREIAIKYECGLPLIQNINNGVIKKYRNPNKKYPLRETRNSIR
jgi:predicted DNA-binding protein YlxM (UPF0122 family)